MQRGGGIADLSLTGKPVAECFHPHFKGTSTLSSEMGH